MCRLQNSVHFVSASMCYLIAPLWRAHITTNGKIFFWNCTKWKKTSRIEWFPIKSVCLCPIKLRVAVESLSIVISTGSGRPSKIATEKWLALSQNINMICCHIFKIALVGNTLCVCDTLTLFLAPYISAVFLKLEYNSINFSWLLMSMELPGKQVIFMKLPGKRARWYVSSGTFTW